MQVRQLENRLDNSSQGWMEGREGGGAEGSEGGREKGREKERKWRKLQGVWPSLCKASRRSGSQVSRAAIPPPHATHVCNSAWLRQMYQVIDKWGRIAHTYFIFPSANGVLQDFWGTILPSCDPFVTISLSLFLQLGLPLFTCFGPSVS